ncbi:hypothetical protein GCM10009647_056000 [Streptomyces sanglieri]
MVWADIEHTPGDHSGSRGKLVDTPDAIGRLVVKQTPIEPHYWALQQVGWEPRQRGRFLVVRHRGSATVEDHNRCRRNTGSDACHPSNGPTASPRSLATQAMQRG